MNFSYSLSMCVRTRCKYCKTEPINFFYVADSWIMKNFNRRVGNSNVVSDFYLISDPKYFKKISLFSCFLGDIVPKMSAKYFHYYKDKFKNTKMPVIIALTCDCNKSIWYTPNDSRRNKSNKCFDKNIKYLL